MAIDDEIDAARSQIEFGKTGIAPKVVITALEGWQQLASLEQNRLPIS